MAQESELNAVPHNWLNYAERRRRAAEKRLERDESEPLQGMREERLAAIRYHATELAWHLSDASEYGVLEALKDFWPKLCRAELARVKE